MVEIASCSARASGAFPLPYDVKLRVQLCSPAPRLRLKLPVYFVPDISVRHGPERGTEGREEEEES